MNTITPLECAELIREGNVCAFSGAGISTAAGIPDFRGIGGLYSSGKYDPDTVFDIDYFKRDPKPFFDFSRDLLNVVDKLRPTKTHLLLAELEAKGLLTSIITQNIDPLHQIAGSKKVISLHGNYATAHCRSCSKLYDYSSIREMIENTDIPECTECGGVVKPDIVFFGESVYGIDEAVLQVSTSELLLVLGSSLVVHPAASLPGLAKRVIVVNKGKVNFLPGENRYFVDSDLDSFFNAVNEYLL